MYTKNASYVLLNQNTNKIKEIYSLKNRINLNIKCMSFKIMNYS